MANVKFTREQKLRLEEISKLDKEKWAEAIHSALPDMNGRTYGNVWQKVYALSGHSKRGSGAKSAGKKAAATRAANKALKKQYPKRVPQNKTKRKKAAKKKVAGTIYKTGGAKDGKRRNLHTSPLRGTTMTATPNEIRFPVESLRIEAGELIVTFK